MRNPSGISSGSRRTNSTASEMLIITVNHPMMRDIGSLRRRGGDRVSQLELAPLPPEMGRRHRETELLPEMGGCDDSEKSLRASDKAKSSVHGLIRPLMKRQRAVQRLAIGQKGCTTRYTPLPQNRLVGPCFPDRRHHFVSQPPLYTLGLFDTACENQVIKTRFGDANNGLIATRGPYGKGTPFIERQPRKRLFMLLNAQKATNIDADEQSFAVFADPFADGVLILEKKWYDAGNQGAPPSQAVAVRDGDAPPKRSPSPMAIIHQIPNLRNRATGHPSSHPAGAHFRLTAPPPRPN